MGFYEDQIDGRLASATATSTNTISATLPSGSAGDYMLAWVYYSSASGTPPTVTGWTNVDGSGGSSGTSFQRWLVSRVRQSGDTSVTFTFGTNFTTANLVVLSLATSTAAGVGAASSADLFVAGAGEEEVTWTEDPISAADWSAIRGYILFLEYTSDSLILDEPPLSWFWGGNTSGGNWAIIGWYGIEAPDPLTITADTFTATTDFLAFWTMVSYPLAMSKLRVGMRMHPT